jgi:hypothetical protein
MYVYSNGKWHAIKRVIAPGQLKIYITLCGQHYSLDCSTSDDNAVLDSKFFCGKCLAIHREKALVN